MSHPASPTSETLPSSTTPMEGVEVAKTTNGTSSQLSNDEDVDMANAPPTTILDEGVASDEPVGSPEIKVKEVSEVKLEDIFAGVDSDEDDDEEFPGRPERVDRDQSNSPGSPREVGSSVKASDPALMRSFYQRLFPWRYLFQWLNHSPTPTDDFKHREFAFTLRNDAYLRYQAFASSDLLRKDVLRLMPSRFEIGPVYSANPRDRKMFQGSAAFRPLSKELCFDIDLTDYDDVRTCCGKANICNKCWQFITMAIKVVDVALRDDFGFKHILWVYSGRRGAHAWVCDKKARTMDDLKRRVIAGYLEVVRGGAQSGKKVNLRRPLHPHLTRSLDILKAHFQDDVLEAQDPWRSPEQSEKLLQLLPDKELIESLRKKWDSSPERASTSKWADIDAVAKASTSKNFDSKALLDAKQDIVLEYTYPRLDIEVSKKLNHLLKSPFVVHPGTGRVCVPIDTRSLEDFDPLGVPTVQSLIREIDAWTEDSDKQSQQDWEKTSLKPYIDCFRSFVMTLMKDERDVRVKREHDEDQPDSLEF